MLKKRNLGKTKILVSEIGLGCWPLGGLSTINGIPTTYGDVDENISMNIIHTALESGIDTFDTADVYSLGNSERRLGKALKDHRSEIHIFTKGGFIPSSITPRPFELDLSYHHLTAALDRSLMRLGMNYVDLFQAHAPPQSENDFVNLEKSFKKIKAEGKALYCGVSIGSEYEKGTQLIERGIVDTIQLYFSLLNFEPIQQLLPFAQKHGIGIIVAEPLAQGILTGKYSQDYLFPTIDERSRYDKKEFSNKIKLSQKFKFLVNEHRTLNQIALSYVLSRDEVSACIPGAKSVDQLRSNVDSSEIKLTADELRQIEEIQHSFVSP